MVLLFRISIIITVIIITSIVAVHIIICCKPICSKLYNKVQVRVPLRFEFPTCAGCSAHTFKLLPGTLRLVGLWGSAVLAVLQGVSKSVQVLC